MKKTGMIRTSIKELRKIIDNMFHQLLEENPKGVYKNSKELMEQGFLTGIINKEGLSDTWRFKK